MIDAIEKDYTLFSWLFAMMSVIGMLAIWLQDFDAMAIVVFGFMGLKLLENIRILKQIQKAKGVVDDGNRK